MHVPGTLSIPAARRHTGTVLRFRKPTPPRDAQTDAARADLTGEPTAERGLSRR
jgi:hypothetical protein